MSTIRKFMHFVASIHEFEFDSGAGASESCILHSESRMQKSDFNGGKEASESCILHS